MCLGGIRGAAFDLDGTLYPNYRLNIALAASVLREKTMLLAFHGARRRLHARAAAGELLQRGGAFYDVQADLMAEKLGEAPARVREKLDRVVYHGWEEPFAHIKPFPHVRETLAAFKNAGIRLGVLSDFPPRRKLELLGLADFFDAAFSTEELGALKPHPEPFRILADALGLASSMETILFVGNNPRYDMAGARAAGMKTALIRRSLLSTGPCPGRKAAAADFVFARYRQLEQYVLG